jgi:hypothetical protein
MKTFLLHWRNGETETIQGENIEQAANLAYGQGALQALSLGQLDYWEDITSDQSVKENDTITSESNVHRQRIMKVRAWDRRYHRMIGFEEIIETMVCSIFLNDDYDIVQYTGLKDKQGEDVCHKDICSYEGFYCGDNYIHSGIGLIEWGDDSWIVVDKTGKYICGLWDLVTNYGGKIIGNIYENPELL